LPRQAVLVSWQFVAVGNKAEQDRIGPPKAEECLLRCRPPAGAMRNDNLGRLEEITVLHQFVHALEAKLDFQ
jgi:hypothetical protein